MTELVFLPDGSYGGETNSDQHRFLDSEPRHQLSRIKKSAPAVLAIAARLAVATLLGRRDSGDDSAAAVCASRRPRGIVLAAVRNEGVGRCGS